MDEKHTAYPVAGSLTEQERHSIEAFYRAFSDKSPGLLNEAVVPDWQDIPLAPGQRPGPDGLKPIINAFVAAFQGQVRMGTGIGSGHYRPRAIRHGNKDS